MAPVLYADDTSLIVKAKMADDTRLIVKAKTVETFQKSLNE